MSWAPTHLLDMNRGDERYTLMSAVHPASATISFDAPLYETPDELAVVMITRDQHGSFHVWGPLSDFYPEPDMTGLCAQFHLTRYVEVHDIGELAELGGWSL